MIESFNWISALLPIAGWLGVGGIGTLVAVLFGVWKPQYLFIALMIGGGLAALTFTYGKGLHDDYVLQQEKTVEALKNELAEETAARQEAENYVKQNPTHQAGAKKPFSSITHPFSGVRDNWDRDSTVNSGPAKGGVQPVESNKLLKK